MWAGLDGLWSWRQLWDRNIGSNDAAHPNYVVHVRCRNVIVSAMWVDQVRVDPIRGSTGVVDDVPTCGNVSNRRTSPKNSDTEVSFGIWLRTTK